MVTSLLRRLLESSELGDLLAGRGQALAQLRGRGLWWSVEVLFHVTVQFSIVILASQDRLQFCTRVYFRRVYF